MNTEQLLLELAAKAAGYVFGWGHDENIDGPYIIDNGFPVPWNPLEDDGDCARLEADLLMTVRIGELSVKSSSETESGRTVFSRVEVVDGHKARRLASTRTAAMIGAKMP